MKTVKLFAALLFCCACYLLLPPALYPQSFSSIDNDLQQLEDLIADTLKNTEEQQKLLEDLQQNLSESGNLIESYESIIARQEQLLADLQKQLNEMSETYRRQSALSARYAQNSKFWRTFTLIAIPATALLSGGLVWAVNR